VNKQVFLLAPVKYGKGLRVLGSRVQGKVMNDELTNDEYRMTNNE
jgi:hypothetical protein